VRERESKRKRKNEEKTRGKEAEGGGAAGGGERGLGKMCPHLAKSIFFCLQNTKKNIYIYVYM